MRLFFFSLIIFLNKILLSKNNFISSVDANPISYNGWYESPWFGNFFNPSKCWIYHVNLGWLYPNQSSHDGYWFYNSELKWIWTDSSFFPWLFINEVSGWKYFNSELGFFDPDHEKWLSWSDLASQLPSQDYIFRSMPEKNTVDLIAYSYKEVSAEGKQIPKLKYHFHNTQENESHYRNSTPHYRIRIAKLSYDDFGILLLSKLNGEMILHNGQYAVGRECGEYFVLYDKAESGSTNLKLGDKALIGGSRNKSVVIPGFIDSNFDPFLDIKIPRFSCDYEQLSVQGCTLFDITYEDKVLEDVITGEIELPDLESYYQLRWTEGNENGETPEKIMFFRGSKDLVPPAPPSNFTVSRSSLFPNLISFSWTRHSDLDSDLLGFRIYVGHETNGDSHFKFSDYLDIKNPSNSYYTPKEQSQFLEVTGKNASYYTYEAIVSPEGIFTKEGEGIVVGNEAAFHIRSIDYSGNISDGQNSNILSLWR